MRIGKVEAVILAVGFVLAAIAYQVSAAVRDRIQLPVSQPAASVTPTAPSLQVANPVQVITTTQEPTIPAYDATSADFFAWQTAQADRSTGRIGEGTPTPSGSVGVHDPGRTDKRSTAAP